MHELRSGGGVDGLAGDGVGQEFLRGEDVMHDQCCNDCRPCCICEMEEDQREWEAKRKAKNSTGPEEGGSSGE